MTSRPSTAAPILAVLAIGLTLFGVYLGGYFWLCETTINASGTYIVRSYQTKWLRDSFKPAARVEGAIRRSEIETSTVQDEQMRIRRLNTFDPTKW